MPIDHDDAATPVEQEALRWVNRAASGEMTEAEVAQLDAWRASNKAHDQAFRDTARLWHIAGAALQAEAPRKRAFLSRRSLLIGGTASATAAAAYAAGVAVGVVPSFDALFADYRTGVGEQRKVSLPDGTAVELDARSGLALDFSGADRKVRLLDGAAIFSVTHDATRPFVVEASDVTVLARGTVFGVGRVGADVTVTCVDGSVDVRCGKVVSLRAAQEVSASNGALGAVSPVDPHTSLAWQRGFLIFRDELLERVVGALNRYRGGRIVLARARLRDQRVSGVFHLSRPDEALDHVKTVLGLSTVSIGGVVLVF